MASERCCREEAAAYLPSIAFAAFRLSLMARLAERDHSFPFLLPLSLHFLALSPPPTSTKNTVDILDGRQRAASLDGLPRSFSSRAGATPRCGHPSRHHYRRSNRGGYVRRWCFESFTPDRRVESARLFLTPFARALFLPIAPRKCPRRVVLMILRN